MLIFFLYQIISNTSRGLPFCSVAFPSFHVLLFYVLGEILPMLKAIAKYPLGENAPTYNVGPLRFTASWNAKGFCYTELVIVKFQQPGRWNEKWPRHYRKGSAGILCNFTDLGSSVASLSPGLGDGGGVGNSIHTDISTSPKTSRVTVSSSRFWPCSDGALISQRYFPASFLVTFLIRILKSIISARSLKSPFRKRRQWC